MQIPGNAKQGTLSSNSFPGLVYSSLSQRETGLLTLSDGRVEKSIYIESGKPVFATSSDRDDRLDQIFFKSGLVSLESLMQAAERALSDEKRLGTVLVEMGLIEPHDLVEAVRTQVKNIIWSLFLWTEGSYHYLQGPLPTKELITLRLSAGNVILEGIRRIESGHRILQAVGGLDNQYQTTEGMEEMARRLDLSLDEWTLLSRCEQPTSLREICRASPMKDFEICRLIWALLTLGIVKRVSGAA